MNSQRSSPTFPRRRFRRTRRGSWHAPATVRIDGKPARFETSAHRMPIPLPDENVKRVDFVP
jgi:hypothetical protein